MNLRNRVSCELWFSHIEGNSITLQLVFVLFSSIPMRNWILPLFEKKTPWIFLEHENKFVFYLAEYMSTPRFTSLDTFTKVMVMTLRHHHRLVVPWTRTCLLLGLKWCCLVPFSFHLTHPLAIFFNWKVWGYNFEGSSEIWILNFYYNTQSSFKKYIFLVSLAL